MILGDEDVLSEPERDEDTGWITVTNTSDEQFIEEGSKQDQAEFYANMNAAIAWEQVRFANRCDVSNANAKTLIAKYPVGVPECMANMSR